VPKAKCEACRKDYHIPPSRVKDKNFCTHECSRAYRKAYPSRRYPITYDVDENGCFICTSHKSGVRGYPRMHETLVFRHVYQEMHGNLEKGELVRHLCDNKLCINPEHLRKGTQLENVRDALRNGRFKVGEEHHSSKHKELNVYAAKVLMKHTQLSNKEISLVTNVSETALQPIRSGENWKSVVVE